MASDITHFIVGSALALPALESRAIRSVLPAWAVLVSSGLIAVTPDLDVLPMWTLGVPYTSFFGHRGFFHSPFFVILFATVLAFLVAGRRSRRAASRLAFLWAVCAVTHPLLDALTDGGYGVMLLFPFTTGRFFLPWRPIHVSPFEFMMFFTRIGYIFPTEVPFWFAAVTIGSLGLWRRRRRPRSIRQQA